MNTFRHLSKTDILQVCALIDNWPLPTLSWNALCREVEAQLKHRYTRQALERKTEIKDRFQARKEHRGKVIPVDESEQKINLLKARVAQLEKTIAEYDRRFLRHIDKAIDWGKTPEDLDAPMFIEIPMLRKP